MKRFCVEAILVLYSIFTEVEVIVVDYNDKYNDNHRKLRCLIVLVTFQTLGGKFGTAIDIFNCGSFMMQVNLMHAHCLTSHNILPAKAGRSVYVTIVPLLPSL